ncbi:flagellar biosynthesis protein FlaG [Vibrio sp. vnigr-6D03]|uniref:Protein FlaG n=1 Tax=Vibrio penaeicida TaxID=104609 RepID=A0AAV5NXC7_9VIBR|nr:MULTISPECIES: flagellar protein FlaG [Vibrio]PKF79087.1 flagellar biosynthesis protein FlaG [Vibrio sp. vnigr-6D03]RTZ19739.1 flagellar biosynthesis protein FlaG [Vibrio penaeicida]GLQ75204.1 protein FlaG [Vibrio penaeicida]
MDISSYTSISQPSYGSGTKIASTAEDVSSANALKRAENEDPKEAIQNDSAQSFAEERTKINADELEKRIDEVNDFISSLNKGLSFKFDDESGRRVVTVFDADTGDIIKQIPSEEMLEILRRLAANSSGLIVEKV